MNKLLNQGCLKNCIKMTIAEKIIKDFVLNVKTIDEHKLEMEEVRINMPFGYIAGKFWGPKVSNFQMNCEKIDHYLFF